MLDILLLCTGLVLLLVGGAGLVSGASGIVRSFGVSPMVIGLTVVAFGTSAPELVVNLIGALRGETEIAFGNVVGSNLANLGLVLGTAALIAPIAMEGQVVRREVPLLLLGTSVLVVLTLDIALRGQAAMLDRSDGLVLGLIFGIFVYNTAGDIGRRRRDDPLVASIERLPHVRIGFADRVKNAAAVAAGSASLAIGGALTIDAGSELAMRWGLAPAVIGMIFVAVGTSLPELVTSVVAALRREPDLCVGNVVGSNIFNSLLVLPVSAVVRPLVVPANGVVDVIATLVLAAVLIPIFAFGQARLGRGVGAALLAYYLLYLTWRTL